MKNKFILIVAVVLAAGLITSCSIEKRHYMSGYHVEWKNKGNQNNTAVNEQSTTVAVNQIQTEAPQQQEYTETVVPQTVNANENETVTGAVEIKNSPVQVAVAPATQQETVKQNKVATNVVKSAIKKAEKQGGDVPKGLLIVLCFLIPWLAVGLATDWDVKTIIINLLWSLTCIGGIIHALIVVNRETK